MLPIFVGSYAVDYRHMVPIFVGSYAVDYRHMVPIFVGSYAVDYRHMLPIFVGSYTVDFRHMLPIFVGSYAVDYSQIRINEINVDTVGWHDIGEFVELKGELFVFVLLFYIFVLNTFVNILYFNLYSILQYVFIILH